MKSRRRNLSPPLHNVKRDKITLNQLSSSV